MQFGDGYQQRQRDGLNTLLRTYQLVFRGSPELGRDIERFFEEHAGVDAFLWTPYDLQERRAFICPEWSSTLFSTHTDINCTFVEVPS
ncbi:phage tail protein [Oceanimonas sp. NS1]|nr:phage tail protein [Oceanimonas sp. NS1]